MKRTIFLSFFLFFFCFFSIAEAYVSVSGYYKSNGTYVAPHVRSEPNGVKYDNYGYKPSQGLYNTTYGTRDSSWDTPSYVTDPYYYEGKSIYDSGNNPYSFPKTPTCPTNSYYDGISSCTCSYGYVSSGGVCVSANDSCHSQLGYSSSYDSVNKTCKCDSGYVIGTYGKCVSGSSYCSDKIGIMSQYNNLSKTCECLSGYEFNGSACVYKKNNYSNTPTSSYNDSTIINCPPNSRPSVTDITKCSCDSGYQVNSTKTSCVVVATGVNNKICTDYYGMNSYWNGTKASSGALVCDCKSGYSWNNTKTSCVVTTYTQTADTSLGQKDDVIGKNYFLKNKTCVGLFGNQLGECVGYAYNH